MFTVIASSLRVYLKTSNMSVKQSSLTLQGALPPILGSSELTFNLVVFSSLFELFFVFFNIQT